MATIEPGVVTELHNLANELEIVYGTTRHREYIPKIGGIRIKRKGNIVYLLLNSDVHAHEGGPVIKMDYRLITDPHAGSPSQLVTILLNWIGTSAGTGSLAGGGALESANYIGKGAGAHGDFNVSYHDNNTINFDTFPMAIYNFTDSDIELVRQINNLGAVVATYDRDDTRMLMVGTELNITGANFNPTDTFVVYTNIPRKEIQSPPTDVYVGKNPGGNGDFDVSYSAAHVIHIDTQPNVGHHLRVDDIEYVRQIDTVSGRVLGEFDRDIASMSIAGDFLTIPAATFAATDEFVVVTNLLKHVFVPDLEFMNSYIGKPANQNGDFSVHYHNFHMIHFADFRMGNITKVNSEDIVQILVLDEDDNVYLHITHDEFDIHTTTNGVQVDGNEFTDIAFQPTDRFIIYTNIPRKTVGRYNNPIVLVTNSQIGIYDDVWRDQGVEIDCRGYNNLSIWCVIQPNDSVGNELRVLSKHTTAGADEYVLENWGNFNKDLGNVNIKIKYDFALDNSTPFVQLQTRMIGVTGTSSTSTSTSSTTSTSTSSTSTNTTNTTPGGTVLGRIWIRYTLGY